MSADAEAEPKVFAFTEENRAVIARIVAKYPPGRQASAVIPLLDMAQRQNGGWLPQAAIEAVATELEMPVIRVWEVATFYTMFNLRPIGRNHVQVCTNLPCWLRGSDEVVATCRKELGVDLGDTTEDGAFTLSEVECLGACVNAPMMQVGDDYYEDLTPEAVATILQDLRDGRQPKTGSQIGRRSSEPVGELTTLTTLATGGDGKRKAPSGKGGGGR